LKEAVEHKPQSARRAFDKALSNPKGLNLICEIKKASPSEGLLRENFQPLRLASLYEFAGASALSVLTETHFFKGRPSYLKTIRQITKLPILRKDFILESYQLYETALLEADAFLLIASLLTDQELSELIHLGKSLGMHALVEVHSEDDLKKALDSGAEIIGINNRNLRTLKVNPNQAKKLIPKIPKGKTVVVESGLDNHDKLMEYKSIGVNAFLIGTAIMKAPDPVNMIQTLLGNPKKLSA